MAVRWCANDGREMTRGSTRGTKQTTSWLALAGALALVVIALSGCATGQAGSTDSSAGTSPSSALQPTGAARPSVRDLVAAFTRSGVGPDQVGIDLTYAPPLFFEVTGLEPPAEASARPTLAFMLQETIHEGALPGGPPTVLLASETGARTAPYDIKVTASDPHHRTTRLLFPDPGEGSTTPQASGREHTLKLVVPFADGTVSAGNTFVWRLPIDLELAAPSTSPGASQ